jgi:hypothetical protein
MPPRQSVWASPRANWASSDRSARPMLFREESMCPRSRAWQASRQGGGIEVSSPVGQGGRVGPADLCGRAYPVAVRCTGEPVFGLIVGGAIPLS